MAQYRVYRLPGGELVLDLQSDLIETATRIVARLIPIEQLGRSLKEANPVFEIDGARLALLTTHLGAVPGAVLRDEVHDLGQQRYAILRAVDMVFTGI
jgi:toxin CcdB